MEISWSITLFQSETIKWITMKYGQTFIYYGTELVNPTGSLSFLWCHHQVDFKASSTD